MDQIPMDQEIPVIVERFAELSRRDLLEGVARPR